MKDLTAEEKCVRRAVSFLSGEPVLHADMLGFLLSDFSIRWLTR